MPEIEVVVSLKVNGAEIPDGPYRRVYNVNEGQALQIVKANGDVSFVTLPGVDYSATLQVLLLSTDAAINLLLANSVDNSIAMGAGALVLVAGVTQNAGASTNAEVKNAGSTSANLKGYAGGS